MSEKYVPKKVTAFVKRVLGTPIFERIIRNSGYLLSATGITTALALVQSVFVLRIIGPSGLGLIAAITSFSSAANQLTSFRIQEMVVRYMRLYTEKNNHNKAAAAYKLAGIFEFVGAALAFVLVWILSPWGAEFFGKDASTQPLWIIYAVYLLFNSIFDSSKGLLQVFDRFDTIATIAVVQKSATVLLSIYWYYNGGDFIDVLLLYLGGKVIGSIGTTTAALITARKQWGKAWWTTSPIMDLKEDFRSILTFTFSTNVSNTISLVTKDSESLWITAFLGTETAGYYNLASSLIGYIKIPLSPLSQTVYPELAREVTNKKWDSVKDTLMRSSRLAAIYIIPLALIFLLIGKPAIGFVYGEEWFPTYPIVLLLMLGQIFDSVFFWNRVALLALNRPVYPTIVNFIGMIIKVGLIFILVEQYQAYAFAGLLSFYYIFTVGLAVLGVRSELNKKMSEPEIA